MAAGRNVQRAPKRSPFAYPGCDCRRAATLASSAASSARPSIATEKWAELEPAHDCFAATSTAIAAADAANSIEFSS